MDVIILAAGKNERLNGICAPYHKPLLVINGRSLILSVKSDTNSFAKRTFVVTAPENTLAISQLLSHTTNEDNVDVIVQHRPRGPGHALIKAMRNSTSDYCFIVCADNVITPEDMLSVYKVYELNAGQVGKENIIVFGGKQLQNGDDAGRFTTFHHSYGFKESSVKGQLFHLPNEAAWLGPLIVNRKKMLGILESCYKQLDPSVELKIGPYLNHLGASHIYPVMINCFDIGVPEALI